jgi:hypothetical protein
MLGNPARGSAPLRGCSRKGLTPSSLRASVLQAVMAETAITALSKKTQGREALMGAWLARTTIKTRTKAKKKVKPF